MSVRNIWTTTYIFWIAIYGFVLWDGVKTLELIREVMPSTQRVAFLTSAADPFSRLLVELFENGGRKLGIAIQTIRVRGVEEFEVAFAAMVNERADAVIVQGSLPRKPAIDITSRSPPIKTPVRSPTL